MTKIDYTDFTIAIREQTPGLFVCSLRIVDQGKEEEDGKKTSSFYENRGSEGQTAETSGRTEDPGLERTGSVPS
jgi:hypothetical protein